MGKAIVTKKIDDEAVFSTFEVLDIVDIKRGRLVQWMREGYIPEGIKTDYGERSKTLFNHGDICSIALFKFLIDMGVDRDSASVIIKDTEQLWNKMRYDHYMLIGKGLNGFNHIILRDDQKLLQLTSYLAARFINLSALRDEIKERCDKLRIKIPLIEFIDQKRIDYK